MTIVILTLMVVCALSGLAVLSCLRTRHAPMRSEPELLVIDGPLPDAAAVDAEEALELRAAGEPA
jgi:hypothetical protein